MRRRPKKKKKTKRVRGRSKERPFVQNFRDKPGRQKMVRRLVKKGPQRRRKPTPPPQDRDPPPSLPLHFARVPKPQSRLQTRPKGPAWQKRGEDLTPTWGKRPPLAPVRRAEVSLVEQEGGLRGSTYPWHRSIWLRTLAPREARQDTMGGTKNPWEN